MQDEYAKDSFSPSGSTFTYTKRLKTSVSRWLTLFSPCLITQIYVRLRFEEILELSAWTKASGNDQPGSSQHTGLGAVYNDNGSRWIFESL